MVGLTRPTGDKLIWWNGELVPEATALVPVTSLGWGGVEGIFEGMRAYANPEIGESYVFRLEAHMDRFMRSLRQIRLECPWTRDELIAACLATLRANEAREDIYLQPLAYSPDAGGGNFFTTSTCAIYIDWWPSPSRLLSGHTLTAGVATYRRISEDAMPPRVKNLSNYRNSKLISREAQRHGYDTAISLNSAGAVAEGPSACVVLVRNGVVITPDLTSGILESVTRDAILTVCREELRLPVEERRVDRSELYTADEIFFVGNAVEVTAITAVDGLAVGDGAPGPVTRRLERLLHDIARGQVNDYADWRSSIGLPIVALTR